MRILYVNNCGEGFAKTVEVSNGTTVAEFFNEKMDGASPRDYNIRVNRNPVDGGYILREEDRVTITPAKIAGARR